MTIKAKWALVIVLLAFLATGCATTDTDAKLDYQRLVGRWEWTYALGYNILTIKTVTVVGEEVFLRCVYEAYNPSWGIDTRGTGTYPTGVIDLRREPNKIAFRWGGRSKSRIDVWWNGGGRMWGTAGFTDWSGDVEYSKK